MVSLRNIFKHAVGASADGHRTLLHSLEDVKLQKIYIDTKNACNYDMLVLIYQCK